MELKTGEVRESFQTQPWDDSGRLELEKMWVSRVTFMSQGVQCVGNLYTPKVAPPSGGFAAIVTHGPSSYVKEMSPTHYAVRLGAEFVVLTFDPRFCGESDGAPRRLELGSFKAQDCRAAGAFLATLATVNPGQIHMFGICMGVNWAIEAVVADPLFKTISVAGGNYMGPPSAETVAKAEQGRKALSDLNETGQPVYVPLVSNIDKSAFMGGGLFERWYGRWADRHPFWNYHGMWENRIATASLAEADHQTNANINIPILMVHGQMCASGPTACRDFFAKLPVVDKKFVWLGHISQVQLYDDPITVDRVAWQVGDWVRAHC